MPIGPRPSTCGESTHFVPFAARRSGLLRGAQPSWQTASGPGRPTQYWNSYHLWRTFVLDFEIQKFSRQCSVSQRELKPGEDFFSVLLPEGGDVVRRDYASESWTGPPDNAIGWWKAQVPDPRANRLHWAPNDVMMHYFQQLYEDASKSEICYVLTLLMVRRRIFKLEATERDTDGREVILLYCPRNETEYRVTVVTPDAPKVVEIQQELAELLFAKGD
jgi:hypothetical protein